MDLTRKAVFLTGGAKGIGRALCESLLNQGAKVFFCDINAATGKATVAELQSQYGAEDVIFAQCDVTDAEQFTGVFRKAVDSFGAVDIFVNNAGILDERVWEQMIAINVTGYIRGCQLALEHMRRDKGGRGGVIINIVSKSGLHSTYNHPVYTATKHAVTGFIQSWATNPRMKEMGVRWGSICPGPVDTDLIALPYDQGRVIDPDTLIKNQADRVKPKAVAEAFMALLEDEDSNGAIVVVWPGELGIKYRKRQLVDSDGTSNPVMVDVPDL